MDAHNPLEDGLADAVRRHVEAHACWFAPAACGTGLVGEAVQALLHLGSCRPCAECAAAGHYVGTGRTPEGHAIQVWFHFEATGPAALDSLAGHGQGSRLLVEAAQVALA